MGAAKYRCECGNCDSAVHKKNKKLNVVNVTSTIMLLLFPKCAICWAAYASLFGFLGLKNIAYNPKLQIVIAAVLLLGSVILLRNHYKRNAWINIVLYSFSLIMMLMVKVNRTDSYIMMSVIASLMMLSNLKFVKNTLPFNNQAA